MHRILATSAILGIALLAIGTQCTDIDPQSDPAGTGPTAAAEPTGAAKSAGEGATLYHHDVYRVGINLLPFAAPDISAAICRRHTPLAWAELLGAAGRCRVLRWLPFTGDDAENLDTGEIVVEAHGASVPLVSAEDGAPCYRPLAEPIPPLAPGDTVRVRSAGGRDVPAFDLALTVPATPTIAAGLDGGRLGAGEAWNLAWTGTDTDDLFVEVLGHDGDQDVKLSCRGLTGSGVGLPADLTGRWPVAGRGRVQVGIERGATSGTTPAVSVVVTRYSEEGTAWVDLRTAP